MVLYALQHTPTYLAIKHSKDTNQSELPHWKGHLASMSDHPKRNAKSAPQTAHDNDNKPTPSSYHNFHKPTPCNTHKQTSRYVQQRDGRKEREKREFMTERGKRKMSDQNFLCSVVMKTSSTIHLGICALWLYVEREFMYNISLTVLKTFCNLNSIGAP